MRHFPCLNGIACGILKRYGSQVQTLSEQNGFLWLRTRLYA
jgi:hypothetical protein